MRRIVSVWLPSWPTDRIRRSLAGAAPPPETPLATVLHDGRRRVLAALDAAAGAAGLRPGMAVAHAQAVRRGLELREADPAGDAAALERLAGWALAFSPLAAADAPDGLWIDASGCAHLHGGEAGLLATIRTRLRHAGFSACVAIADTPGAAHAVARHGSDAEVVVPQDSVAAAVAPLPVACLRLPPEVAEKLHRLGFDRVGQLVAAPRAPLARRFGPALWQRLDQALGRAFEPIVPAQPRGVPLRREAFVEPLLTPDAFAVALARLAEGLCAELEAAGQGVRRLDLVFERVDGATPALRIGTARPSRDPVHLARLLTPGLERIDPGLGIEAMRLAAPLTETLAYAQAPAVLAGDAAQAADVAPLVDRLQGRLGAAQVFRAAAVQSDVPERSVAWIAPLSPPTQATWPAELPRPARLFDPPQPVEALALLPDHPPRAFTWRARRHRIRRADGPERIAGEWWKRSVETWAVRDYFQVEDEEGRRFWLFRRGDGVDPATGDQSWHLHGVF